MNLTKKLLLFLFLQVIIFSGILSFFIFFILFPGYKDLEENAAKTSINQVVTSIQREIEHLHTFTLDWAAWDEMARYTLSRDPQFEEKNFSSLKRQMYHLDLIGVFSIDRNLISMQTEQTLIHSKIQSKLIDNSHRLMKGLADRSDMTTGGIAGVFWIEDQALLLSIRPIGNKASTEESYGYLVLGRIIDANLMEILIEQSGISFELSLSERYLEPDTIETAIDDNAPTILIATKNIPDIFGKSNTAIVASVERTIFQKGNESFHYFIIITLAVGILFLIFSLMFMHFLILDPIKKLKKQMQWIIDHESFEPIEKGKQLADEFTDLADQFNRLVEYAKHQNEQLKQLTRIDPLTSLNNRRAMDEYLISQSALLHRQQQPLSLMMLDIDHFKLYNDTYGHIQGDAVIKAVAEVIRQSVHRPSDFTARFGGEEFAIILPYTAIEDCQKIAETICQSVMDLKIEHSASTTSDFVTVSIGITSHIPDSENISSILLHEADKALYSAKESGRNGVRSF